MPVGAPSGAPHGSAPAGSSASSAASAASSVHLTNDAEPASAAVENPSAGASESAGGISNHASGRSTPKRRRAEDWIPASAQRQRVGCIMIRRDRDVLILEGHFRAGGHDSGNLYTNMLHALDAQEQACGTHMFEVMRARIVQRERESTPRPSLQPWEFMEGGAAVDDLDSDELNSGSYVGNEGSSEMDDFPVGICGSRPAPRDE